jgi:hypothetical protein
MDIVLVEMSIIITYSLQYKNVPRLNIVTIPELKTKGQKKKKDNGRGLTCTSISKRKISRVKSTGNSFAARFHLLLPQLVV